MVVEAYIKQWLNSSLFSMVVVSEIVLRVKETSQSAGWFATH